MTNDRKRRRAWRQIKAVLWFLKEEEDKEKEGWEEEYESKDQTILNIKVDHCCHCCPKTMRREMP